MAIRGARHGPPTARVSGRPSMAMGPHPSDIYGPVDLTAQHKVPLFDEATRCQRLRRRARWRRQRRASSARSPNWQTSGGCARRRRFRPAPPTWARQAGQCQRVGQVNVPPPHHQVGAGGGPDAGGRAVATPLVGSVAALRHGCRRHALDLRRVDLAVLVTPGSRGVDAHDEQVLRRVHGLEFGAEDFGVPS